MPTDPCPACSQFTSQSKAGKRGKAGKGGGGGCSPTEKLIQVDLLTDNFPEETVWTVAKTIEYEGASYTSLDPVLSGGPYASDDSNDNKLFQDAVCVPEGQYTFTIYVSDLQYIFAAMFTTTLHTFD